MRTLDLAIQERCIYVGRWGPRVEIFGILEAGVQGGAVRTRTPLQGWGVLGLDGKIEGLGC